jgi:imidazole glycerol-phosphate synthase subunit HisH
LIAIIDYGLGNVQAIANIYKRLNVSAVVARSASELIGATHLILPGVGAFDWVMARLNDSGMRGTLDDLVRGDRIPVLGICVGMQIMAHSSDEGIARGLGWIDANVKLFDKSKFFCRTHLPHMGWNDIEMVCNDELFRDLGESPLFYFLHSYYFSPADPEDTLATTDYGEHFTCVVRRQNVYGVQFHPEKSHRWGIQLLKNFADI